MKKNIRSDREEVMSPDGSKEVWLLHSRVAVFLLRRVLTLNKIGGSFVAVARFLPCSLKDHCFASVQKKVPTVCALLFVLKEEARILCADHLPPSWTTCTR